MCFKLKLIIYVGLVFAGFLSCKQNERHPDKKTTLELEKIRIADSSAFAERQRVEKIAALQKKEAQRLKIQLEKRKSLDTMAAASFVNLAELSDDFVFDLKYATTDNFLKQSVYDCPKCYVRVPTAKALLAANADFIEKEYRIKFFDCYRPHSVQKIMWKIFPNPHYLARPTKGSIHNKGGAVDMTLVDKEGEELDMGTGFDHFEEEAHHAYTNLSEAVLKNRNILRETMKKHGFWTIRTEWWHYNYRGASKNALADFRWNCE